LAILNHTVQYSKMGDGMQWLSARFGSPNVACRAESVG